MSACATTGRSVHLSALGKTHVREGFRVELQGTAIVLPILDCNSDRTDVNVNIDARQLAAVALPGEIWKQLGLPEEPQDGRVLQSDAWCRDLVDNRESGINVDMASPFIRERLREYFDHYSGRRWLVVMARTLRLGDRVKGDGGGVGALAGQISETGTVAASAYVFSPSGAVVFRGDLECSANNPDEHHDCGADFGKASQRIAEMLEGFPRSIVSDVSVVKAVRPEEAPIAPREMVPPVIVPEGALQPVAREETVAATSSAPKSVKLVTLGKGGKVGKKHGKKFVRRRRKR